MIYALTGFAAGKVGNYDLSATMLNQSLAVDPEYARPYIGLANVAFELRIDESGIDPPMTRLA